MNDLYANPSFSGRAKPEVSDDRATVELVQWNLSVTTTSIIKVIICDLFSNMF